MNNENEDGVLHVEQVFERTKIEHHELEQRGNDLVCTSCNTPHAQIGFFRPGEVLTRDEQGNYRKLTTKEDAEHRAY